MTNRWTSVSLAALTVVIIACPAALAQVAPPPAPAPPLEPLPRPESAPPAKIAADGGEVGAVVESRPTAPGYSLATFIALGVLSHGASVFDAAITRQEVREGGYEENPLVRPYVRSYALFAVTQIGPFIYDGLGWLMTRSNHRWIRRLWWLPQTFNAVTCVAAGFYDLR
jgi:hypothetical protein